MRLIHVVLAVFLNFVPFGSASGSDRAVQAEAQKFLSALLSRDERALIAFGDDEQVFSDGVRLNQDIADFLYRRTGEKNKSVLDIARMGRISIKVIPQPDSSFIALFYPNKFKKRVDTSVTFLQTQWMERYFACAFRWSNGQLVLHQNFCFAETDGPFSAS